MSRSKRSLLEILNGLIKLDLLCDQRLTQALSYVLCETFLCLNILNIFLVGPPPLSRCAPLTVLTLSNLLGGALFPISPPTDPLWHSLNLTFTHSTEVLPTFLLTLSGVSTFSTVFLFGTRKRKQSYCQSATCHSMKTKL